MDDKKRVLIVDDQAETRYLLEAFLTEDGYDLYSARNGQECLGQVEKISPDVILLDVMMPGMNGYEVCQLLKTDKRWQQIPIIMITALPGKNDMARGFEAGADDFIIKPFANIEVSARVRSMLRIKSQYDRLEKQRQDLESVLQLREDLTRVTAQRLEELEMLHNVGLDLMNSLDSIFMVQLVAETALELITNSLHCVVHFLSDDEQHLLPTVFPAGSKQSSIENSLGNEDLIKQAIELKETVYIPDLIPNADPVSFDSDGMHTVLVIPLIVDGRAIGTIGIDSPEADAFEIADRRILSILASQLAVSIMKARLFESLGAGDAG